LVGPVDAAIARRAVLRYADLTSSTVIG